MRYPLLKDQAEGRPLTDLALQVNMPRPSTRRKMSSGLVRFDTITEDMIEMFAYGECTVLATALHQFTGWTFANVWRGCCTFTTRTLSCWDHVGVLTPEGLFVDIYGTQTTAEALNHQHPGCYIETSSINELADARLIPRSGTVEGFFDMFSMEPLFAEVALLLAEQILTTPSWGVRMERAA